MENNNGIQVISRNLKNLTQNYKIIDVLELSTQFLIILVLFFIIYYLINIGNLYIDNKKRINIKKRYIIYFILSFILFVFIIALIQSWSLIYEILSPFIFAIILAYILNPIVTYIENRGVKRLWSVFLIYFIIASIVFIFSITLLPKLTLEVKRLLEVLPKLGNDSYEHIYNTYVKYNNNIESLPVELNGVKEVLKFNVDKAEKILLNIISVVTNSILTMLSKVVIIVLIPILTFYFLKDANKFKKILILIIPKSWRKGIIEVAKDIDVVLGGFIRGQLIVAGLVGVLTTVSLIILRVEFAALVGMIAGISDIIPYFGPIVGIIPAIIFASLGGLNKVLWVIIIFIIIQQIESSVITPKIIGENVGLHPVVVILALITAGKLFGLFGLLVAVPTAGVIKVVGKHLINYIAKF